MASLHEAHHASLNSSTAWGALLQALMIAVRHARDPGRFKATLGDLVRSCRRTHEAFATHASVMDIAAADAAIAPERLLGGYRDYRRYFDTAVQVGPDADIMARRVQRLGRVR